jgi:hypothetical protein
MRRFIPWAAVLLVGCSGQVRLEVRGGNPESSALAAGDEAMTHDPEHSTVVFMNENDRGRLLIGVGLRVRVVSDPRDNSEHRLVRVAVVEGDMKGAVGGIYRHNLRPLPR